MTSKARTYARAIHVLEKGETAMGHAMRFTRQWSTGWMSYNQKLLSLSRAALNTGDVLGLLKGSSEAAGGAMLTTFDAWAGLVGGALSPHESGSAALDFDKDTESAGPETVDLAHVPAGARPVSADLVLAERRAGGKASKIPKTHVEARLEGDTLSIKIVDLKKIRGSLEFGEYRGDIKLGSGYTVPVSAFYRKKTPPAPSLWPWFLDSSVIETLQTALANLADTTIEPLPKRRSKKAVGTGGKTPKKPQKP